eukprot:scaffold47719_cov78-Phaeocystis_antarctica.AAC.1
MARLLTQLADALGRQLRAAGQDVRAPVAIRLAVRAPAEADMRARGRRNRHRLHDGGDVARADAPRRLGLPTRLRSRSP